MRNITSEIVNKVNDDEFSLVSVGMCCVWFLSEVVPQECSKLMLCSCMGLDA